VVDGTIATLAALKAHASAFLVPSRTEADITQHFSGEDKDFYEQGSSGLMVLADRVKNGHGYGFTINSGRWSFELQALKRGQSNTDVANNQTLSVALANDVTNATGIPSMTTILKEKFVALIELPVNPDDNKTLYLLVQRVIAASNDGDVVMNKNQINTAIRFDASKLEADEIAPYQALHAQVTDDGLYYYVEG